VIYLTIDIIKSKGGEIIFANEGGKKIASYFETAKKYLLNDPKDLLNVLLEFDKTTINDKMIKNLDKDCWTSPKFNLESAANSSHAVKYLFSLCKAMYDFYKVYTETEPLRIKLDEMRLEV